MKRAFLLIVMLLVAITVRAEQFEDTVHKSFPVNGGGKLTLDADIGNVEIMTDASNTVQVDVYRRVDTHDKAEADKIFQDFSLEAKQTGNNIDLRGIFQDGWRSGWSGNYCRNGECLWYGKKLKVHRYQIHLPKTFSVEVGTGAGDIYVGDLQSVDLNTSGGDIRVGQIAGEVKANTSGGNIKVLKASRADVETSGGDIEIGEVNGDVIAHTSGGGIEIKHGKNVEAETSGGDINLSSVEGTVRADTSGGSIEAHLRQQPNGDCRLETSAGEVMVYLPKTAKMNIDATTDNGEVMVTDFILTDSVHREDRLNGAINGGGPRLILRSSSGDIEVRPE